MLRTVVFASLLACLPCVPALAQKTAAQEPATQKPAIVPAAPSASSASPKTVSQQVLDAEAAIGKSDWKTAEAKLTPWIAAHPADARALFDAGYVADAQNHLTQAAHYYRRAIQANPKSFEAHLSLGLLLARQGKLTEARPQLVDATKLNPGPAGPALKARAWRALAQIDRPRPGHPGNASEASNDLLQALKLSPETNDDTLLAASLAEDSGDYKSAEAAYRRVLVKDPKSEAANSGLAHILIKKQQYSQAETLLRKALKETPNDPVLNTQLALVLAEENNPQALPLTEKLHKAHPNDNGITGMLAQLLSDAGNYAASDQLYTTLLAADPNNESLLVSHGQNLVELRKFPDAFLVFKKAASLNPSDPNAWSGLAFTASKTGQPSIALHALTMRSKFLPNNASTYFLWATSYDTLHDKKQAALYYHRFLDSAAGKFPNEEWQARQRLRVLGKKK